MTVRGSFDQVIKPGSRMPKGKPYHEKKPSKKAEKKKEEKKVPVKGQRMSPRRVSV